MKSLRIAAASATGRRGRAARRAERRVDGFGPEHPAVRRPAGEDGVAEGVRRGLAEDGDEARHGLQRAAAAARRRFGRAQMPSCEFETRHRADGAFGGLTMPTKIARRATPPATTKAPAEAGGEGTDHQGRGEAGGGNFTAAAKPAPSGKGGSAQFTRHDRGRGQKAHRAEAQRGADRTRSRADGLKPVLLARLVEALAGGELRRRPRSRHPRRRLRRTSARAAPAPRRHPRRRLRRAAPAPAPRRRPHGAPAPPAADAADEDDTDKKLWGGAFAAGWRVRPMEGKANRFVYTAPDGAEHTSQTSARAAKNSAAAAAPLRPTRCERRRRPRV